MHEKKICGMCPWTLPAGFGVRVMEKEKKLHAGNC